MPPTWPVALSWFALAVGFTTAGEIVHDITSRGYRQLMGVMNIA